MAGKQIGGKNGTLIGALIGGAAGFFIGNYIDERRAAQVEIAKEHKIEMEFDNIARADSKSDQKDKAIITDDNQFASGRAELNQNAKKYYEKIAQSYTQKDKKILIVGHTDDSGSPLVNQKLSEARAHSVGEIFARNGVSSSNIYYLGRGQNEPRADNHTEAGRKKNRRVEIIELDKEEDIAIYSASSIVKSEFLRSSDLIAQNNIEDSIESASPTSSTQQNSAQKPAPKSKRVAAKPQKVAQNTKQNSTFKFKTKPTNIINFNGQFSNTKTLALQNEFGEIKSGFLSLSQKQDAKSLPNCVYTQNLAQTQAKSLDTGRAISIPTSKYFKALNNSSWISELNLSTIGITNIAVLESGELVQNPNVYVWKEYILGSKKNADYSLKAYAESKVGTNGLLYRVFVDDEKAPIKCMDIVFNNKNPSTSKGIAYYANANGQILEKEFSIESLRSK